MHASEVSFFNLRLKWQKSGQGIETPNTYIPIQFWTWSHPLQLLGTWIHFGNRAPLEPCHYIAEVELICSLLDSAEYWKASLFLNIRGLKKCPHFLFHRPKYHLIMSLSKLGCMWEVDVKIVWFKLLSVEIVLGPNNGNLIPNLDTSRKVRKMVVSPLITWPVPFTIVERLCNCCYVCK